jgi:hypothetical protein
MPDLPVSDGAPRNSVPSSKPFLFSQSSLQDFVDCRRRFYLRYLLRLAWPAIQSEPVMENERMIQQGERFHRLVHQRLVGVPDERLEALIHDDELHQWWENFRAWDGATGSAARYPEVSLSAPFEGHRLVANYDLIAVNPQGRFTIFDWKTYHKRPRRAWLEGRLQTRVYLCLLALAGAHFNAGKVVPPEQIEMVYWFAAFPDQPERFPYSAARLAEDRAYLTGLVGEVTRLAALAAPGRKPDDHSPLQDSNLLLAADHFPRTEHEERCAFCVYRSLCQRGERAGALAEAEEGAAVESDADVSIDFEQIAEIEF